MKQILNYFTGLEKTLWISSLLIIISSFCIFDRENYITLIASVIGATAIIIYSKGNPIGQFLMIIFCVIYAGISYSYAYYGELITYAFMTLPMAVISFISWLRHPYKGNKAEVQMDRVSRKEMVVLGIVAVIVTVAFYFVLKAFGTANILPSTISVTTSFIAVYLSFRRSPYFSIAYAFNDIVLIVLWVLASMEDITYVSVVACFLAFLVNDIYSFISLKKIEKRQYNI